MFSLFTCFTRGINVTITPHEYYTAGFLHLNDNINFELGRSYSAFVFIDGITSVMMEYYERSYRGYDPLVLMNNGNFQFFYEIKVSSSYPNCRFYDISFNGSPKKDAFFEIYVLLDQICSKPSIAVTGDHLYYQKYAKINNQYTLETVCIFAPGKGLRSASNINIDIGSGAQIKLYSNSTNVPIKFSGEASIFQTGPFFIGIGPESTINPFYLSIIPSIPDINDHFKDCMASSVLRVEPGYSYQTNSALETESEKSCTKALKKRNTWNNLLGLWITLIIIGILLPTICLVGIYHFHWFGYGTKRVTPESNSNQNLTEIMNPQNDCPPVSYYTQPNSMNSFNNSKL